MVIEEHEMSIRLEMFFVQFDSFCLDSMSPFPPFVFRSIFFFFLLFFRHILHQWVFPYTSGLLDKQITHSSAIPLQSGSWRRIQTRCFRGQNNRNYARLPLGLYWRGGGLIPFSFEVFESVSVHVGATSSVC